MAYINKEDERNYYKKKKANRKAAGLCTRCGKPCDTLISTCSACTEKYRKPRKAVDGRRRKVWAHCASCGDPIPKGKKYCSMECRDKHRTVTKVCPVCGKEFTVSKSTAHRYIVCSLTCKKKLSVKTICRRCGKVFSHAKIQNRHYCSEECRRPPILVKCDYCGREFRVTPSQYASSIFHYCGFPCYRKHAGATGSSGLEVAIAAVLTQYAIEFVREYAVGRDVFDFYIPAGSLLLEADGDYWHKSAKVQARDAAKTQRAINIGFNVVRLPESQIVKDTGYMWLAELIDRYHLLTPDAPALQPSLFSSFL